MKHLFMIGLFFVGFIANGYTPSSASVYEIADGVTYYRYTFDSLYGGYQDVYVTEVDLSNENLEVGIGICENYSRANTTTLAGRHNAIAAINFGYFGMSYPTNAVGLVKYQGNFFKTNNGEKNYQVEGFFWVHNSYGGVTTFDKYTANMADNIRYSYPILVQNGEVYDVLSAVTYDESGIITDRVGRTAVGVTIDRQTLYMVVFDELGRRYGVTCKELADFMVSIGCYEAMNMDGGGSSTMWNSKLGRVNTPQNGTYEREIFDILYVRYKEINTPETNTSNAEKPDAGTEEMTTKTDR